MRWTVKASTRPRGFVRCVFVAPVLLLLSATACGSGDLPSAQQLGGQAAADLERTWEVTLEVVEVVPADAEVGELDGTRAYRFERGGCSDEVEVQVEEGSPALAPEDITVKTDLDSCVGTATVEVAGATVTGLAVVQVDDTTFAMTYEARVRCLDDAGSPVGALAQVHQLEWQLEAIDAPHLLTGELVRTIHTDPGCAPPDGQESGTVHRLRGLPVEAR